jgi:hypothetical protein
MPNFHFKEKKTRALRAFEVQQHPRVTNEGTHFRMKNMKPHLKKPFRIQGRTFLAALAALALSTAHLSAGDAKSAVPASVLSKLDNHLTLVVKKSHGEAPFDKPTTLQPDVFQSGGRVLVEIEGSISRELSDYIASLGGQLIPGWGTATNFRAWVPFAQVEALAARADIKSITAARPTVTRRLKAH